MEELLFCSLFLLVVYLFAQTPFRIVLPISDEKNTPTPIAMIDMNNTITQMTVGIDVSLPAALTKANNMYSVTDRITPITPIIHKCETKPYMI